MASARASGASVGRWASCGAGAPVSPGRQFDVCSPRSHAPYELSRVRTSVLPPTRSACANRPAMVSASRASMTCRPGEPISAHRRRRRRGSDRGRSSRTPVPPITAASRPSKSNSPLIYVSGAPLLAWLPAWAASLLLEARTTVRSHLSRFCQMTYCRTINTRQFEGDDHDQICARHAAVIRRDACFETLMRSSSASRVWGAAEHRPVRMTT